MQAARCLFSPRSSRGARRSAGGGVQSPAAFVDLRSRVEAELVPETLTQSPLGGLVDGASAAHGDHSSLLLL